MQPRISLQLLSQANSAVLHAAAQQLSRALTEAAQCLGRAVPCLCCLLHTGLLEGKLSKTLPLPLHGITLCWQLLHETRLSVHQNFEFLRAILRTAGNSGELVKTGCCCKLTMSTSWNTHNLSIPTNMEKESNDHSAICWILQRSSLLCNFFFKQIKAILTLNAEWCL